MTAVKATGTDQIARDSRQLPCSRGSSTGRVISVGRSWPIISPFEYVAVPKPTCVGNHWRTMTGIDGCMIATPKAGDDGGSEQSCRVRTHAAQCGAEGHDQQSSPTSVGRIPRRAISSEPGRAAMENNNTGKLISRPTAVADRCRSARISGSRGGTARMVRRKPVPESQSNIA